MTKSDKSFHVIVVGSGPAGLAAALALTRPQDAVGSVRVTILELRPVLGTLGGAINMSPLAMRYLDSLGVGPRLRALGSKTNKLEMVSLRTGKRIAQLWPGADNLRVGRQDLVESMMAVLQERPQRQVTVRFGATINRIEEFGTAEGQGSVKVAFEHEGADEELEGDVLLGCDGIHSFVRSSLVDPERKKEYSGRAGTGGYVEVDVPGDAGITRGDGEPAVADTTLISSQFGHLLVSFYEPSRTKLFIAGVLNLKETKHLEASRDGWKAMGADREGIKGDMTRMFAGPSLKGLGEAIKRCDEWFFFPVYMLPPGGKWRKGRVLLLGDAAHAMPPQGESTGIAMEDGILFAHVFSRRQTRSVDQILSDYETLRRGEIDKLYKETVYRWKQGSRTSWIGTVVLEWLTWVVVAIMNWRQKDYFARDVTKLKLPE